MTTDNEQTTAVATRGTDLVSKGEIVLLPPDSLLPDHSELKIMQMIAASVIGARGHAVPKEFDSIPKAMAVMIAGWEAGFRPMTALRHFFVINGRTEPDAQAMAAIVMGRDPSARFTWVEYSSTICEVVLERAGRKPVRVSYTLDDAKKSGQLEKSGPWKQYTRDMLAWSAMKRACRLGAPELINLPALALRDVTELVEQLGPVDGEHEQLASMPADALNPGDYVEPDYGDEPDDNAALHGVGISEAQEQAREVRQGAARSYPSPAHAALVADLEDRSFEVGEPRVTDWLATVGVVVGKSIADSVAKLTSKQCEHVRAMLAADGPTNAQGSLV